MITAETVNGIVRFKANGLPVVSLSAALTPARVSGRCAPGWTACWTKSARWPRIVPSITGTGWRRSFGSLFHRERQGRGR